MMEKVAMRQAGDEAGSVAETRDRRALSEQETAYMRGYKAPVTSSVLVSSSKYLNNPYFLDTFAQFGLRKMSDDLPHAYMIPDMIRALAEVRDDGEFYDLVQAERELKPDFATWLDRRRLTAYDPTQMQHHADGTLGAMIRDFMTKSGLDIQFMKAGLEPRNDLEYMIKRRTAQHDIEHMVTGFNPSILGENALAVMNNMSICQYFSPKLAQYLNEANMFVTTTGLHRVSLHRPELVPHYYEAWQQGIAAGKAIKMPLIMVDWEDYLDMTPDEACEALGFVRGPAEAWDFSREKPEN